jgi:hypothetical protein
MANAEAGHAYCPKVANADGRPCKQAGAGLDFERPVETCKPIRLPLGVNHRQNQDHVLSIYLMAASGAGLLPARKRAHADERVAF